MSNIGGARIAGSSPARGRVIGDFYATAPETTRSILDEINLKGSILEPACGQGHISEILKEYYPNNEIVSTDLYDRGFGETGIDFLTHDYGRKFDNIITNPPFKYMKQFAERSLELATDKVVLFGKIQFLESKSRKELFADNKPKYVYVFSERQHLYRNGKPFDENGKKWSTVICFAWFVWEKGFDGETTLRWL